MATIHSNQQACGDEILRRMFERNRAFVLLLSQMQMGKSGTYWHVAFEAIRLHGIERVYVISGNRETELREQVVRDAKDYTRSYGKQYRRNIRILWGGALFSKKGSVTVPNNSLIVWDEAHYAQSTNNAPYKFFKHNGMHNVLNGSEDGATMLERNIRLLTVSATPFSELSSSMLKLYEGHEIVRLEPSESYIGVAHYLRRELIHESFHIDESHEGALESFLSSYESERRYLILRVNNTRDKTATIQKVCDRVGVRCEVFNGKVQTIAIEELKNKPDRTTVLVISGMLRMGKVLPKEHIAVVFEEPTKNNTRQSDTGLQGLLGRVCGHVKDTSVDIHVYVEPSMIERAHEYVESYTSAEGPCCDRAMNLRTGMAALPRQPPNSITVPLSQLPEKLRRSNIVAFVCAQYPELESMKCVIKNLERDCNRAALSKLKMGTYATRLESGTYTIYKHKTETKSAMWLVMTDPSYDLDTQTPSYQTPSCQTDQLLDKCVFK
jgi:hypothetical protein